MDQGGNRAGQVLASLLAGEDVQEALDAQCASDEYMRFSQEREEKLLGTPPSKAISTAQESQSICPDVRRAFMGFVGRLIAALQLPEKCLFEAQLLIDIHLQRSATPVQVAELPALCGAVVRIIKKVDNAQVIPNSRGILAYAAQFAQWLRQAGHNMDPSAITEKSLAEQEQLVLQAVRWQLSLPTVDSWMSAFCARMNLLTRQAVFPSLVAIWQQSIPLAQRMFSQRANSERFSPKHVSQGLLGLGCVVAGLLPANALGLEADEDLSSFFPQIPPQPANGSAQAELRQQFFVELLQSATRSGLAELRIDCRLVLTELQNTQATPDGSDQGSAGGAAQVYHTRV